MASDNSNDADNDHDVQVVVSEEQLEETATNPSTSVSFEFVDHFSLRQPSATIRSRGVTTRVYDVGDHQMQLEQRSEIVRGEERGKDRVKIVTKMKRLGGGGNLGLIFLRMCYALVSLLMAGFTFVFAANVIVMQAMEIPRNLGQPAGASVNVAVAVANILSLPLLVYSMASLVIFALVFVGDAWSGHVALRLLLPARAPRVYLEWYSFVLYLGIPMLVLCIAAFAGANNTKEIGGLAWYCCINVGFLIFCALVFYNEIKLCLDLTRLRHPDLGNADLLKRAVLTTLTQRYCGVEERYFMVRRGGDNLAASTLSEARPVRTHRSLYTRLSSLSRNPFFLPVEPPNRRYSIRELQETVPVVTNQSWSLDKACCSLGNGRSQFATRGPDALEPRQSRGGLVCVLLGINLGCLIAVATLYAMGIVTGAGGAVVVYLVGLILIGLPCAWSAFQVYRATTLAQDGDDDDEEPVFQTWTHFTVTKPKEWYCWFRLVVAFGFFFLWPAITFFTDGLPKAGVLFFFTSIFSAARHNLDAGSILREHSSLSEVKFVNEDEDESSQQQMLARARAAQVLGKITNSTYYFIFIIIFGVMGGYFIYSGASSAGSGENFTTQTGRDPIRLLDDFYYPPQTQDILYPNCKLTDHFALPGLNNTYAMDYNFLGGIAYEATNVTNYLLGKWFLRSNFSIEEADFVKRWRRDSGNAVEQVSFKLFSFPTSPGVGILSIRGTETPMDRLFNSQMYLGTVLTQLVRALMPFSWIWNSIYDDLLLTSNWVASDHLRKSDYYRITTDFANDLLQKNYSVDGKSFQWLRTTGVSLGGGLALITGAQTDAYGFAYSGPNPTLGRKTFSPPISMQQLKERVINIKPDNDFVSSIGDLVPNYQLVRCRDWPAKVHNCHSFWRIFCEYLYTCGSPVDRAGVICVCATKWGYPKPTARGNRTFEQACEEEEAALVDNLGDIFKDVDY